LSQIIHTDALQQARFAALTPEQQMLEIWLNTNETNGHVADAQRDIAGAIARSAAHERTLTAHLGEHSEAQAGIDYVKVWGARGTGGILLMVGIIGGINIVLTLLQQFS